MEKLPGEIREFSCPWCGNGFVPRNDIAAFDAKKAELRRIQNKLEEAMIALRICSNKKLSNRHIIAENTLKELLK